jgi:hypothetical protein
MRLPALRLPALLLPALAACAAPAGVKPCPEGSSRRASDGLCVLDSGAPSGADGGADGGGGGADGGGDGADGGADGGGGGELTLPALCEAPAGLGPDPVQLVGEIDLRAMKLVSRARWSLRHVEETDHLRAGRIDHSAETILRMRAKNAIVQVTSLVKVDGAQIQLG